MNTRRLVTGAHDAAMTAVALLVSFLLRWGSADFSARLGPILLVCALAMPFALGAYGALRLDRSPWKFASIQDLSRIALAATVPALFLVLVDFLSRGALIVPRTVPVIYWLLQVFLLAAPRLAYRVYRHRRRERRAFRGVYRPPVLIAGADDEADQLIRRLGTDAVSSLDPVGILSGKARHVGERIRDVPILGRLGDLEGALRALEARGVKPRRLILTRDAMRAAEIDALLGTARRLGLQIVRLSQGLTELEATDAPIRLSPVTIGDLLGREPRELDLGPVRALVSGRRTLVTGAGGSIGSELCRQLAAMGAAELVLFELSELALWQIGRELAAAHPGLSIVRQLGDVCDRSTVARVFAGARPEIVFHAAALKHVDIVESHVVAGARTNTLGTAEIAAAATAGGAACAVFISTDKAVDPVSVLGASKRAAEHVWAEADRRARGTGGTTRFVTVRFGNVLGSSGSVIPLFAEQIRLGGPVTVTDPEVERYFMTIPEAVRLVLMASSLGIAAIEASPTYVLDMGEPVRIVDLARRMIRLAGFEPDHEIAIAFSGLRPGERLREVLQSGDEEVRPTTVAGVSGTDAASGDAEELARRIEGLRDAVGRDDAAMVLALLGSIVPEYKSYEIVRTDS